MVDQGLFEGEAIELLSGELVEMSPQGSAHRWVLARLTAILAPLIADGYELAVQLPLAVDDTSLPNPTSRSPTPRPPRVIPARPTSSSRSR